MTVNPVNIGLQMRVQKYEVIGRSAPTLKHPEPKIYRMHVFSKNHVIAKSRFWYIMRKMEKAKRAGGEILSCKVIEDKKPDKVKNFAIWLRYDSRTGTHNMYKEYRDLTEAGAVSQMYAEMTGRHRALHCSIRIIRIAEIKDSMCNRQHIIQLLGPNVKFPMVKRITRVSKNKRKTFSAVRPTTFQN